MTKHEVKEEMRQVEGDPKVKARLKNVMRQLASKRMMAAVPEADVVVTNPTHIAVALKYDSSTRLPPRWSPREGLRGREQENHGSGQRGRHPPGGKPGVGPESVQSGGSRRTIPTPCTGPWLKSWPISTASKRLPGVPGERCCASRPRCPSGRAWASTKANSS